MTLFDREPLYAELCRRGFDEWAESLRQLCEHRLQSDKHGTLSSWIQSYQRLPQVDDATMSAADDAVSVRGTLAATEREQLRETLMGFHPWRKGPFDLFGINVDTEWRSDLKWNRFCDAIDLRDKFVLDIGGGNGYYGWKMLAAGADFVIGCDPMLLFIMQFEVLARYASQPQRHFVMPMTDADLPTRLHAFDVTFSMGVLYHRTSPIDHLQAIWNSLRPGGQLVLETLIIQSDKAEVLVPKDRYAKMRNVWFIPSIGMLDLWLHRTGFCDVQVVNISQTTPTEQRSTDWMTFDSLADFLDSEDPNKTCEGYPGPVRAIVKAKSVS